MLGEGVELEGPVHRVGAAVPGDLRGEQHGGVGAGDEVDGETDQFRLLLYFFHVSIVHQEDAWLTMRTGTTCR